MLPLMNCVSSCFEIGIWTCQLTEYLTINYYDILHINIWNNNPLFLSGILSKRYNIKSFLCVIQLIWTITLNIFNVSITIYTMYNYIVKKYTVNNVYIYLVTKITWTCNLYLIPVDLPYWNCHYCPEQSYKLTSWWYISSIGTRQ